MKKKTNCVFLRIQKLGSQNLFVEISVLVANMLRERTGVEGFLFVINLANLGRYPVPLSVNTKEIAWVDED